MANGADTRTRREIVSHTSIRGVAAVIVAATHMALSFGLDFKPTVFGPVLSQFDVFVDLFFVLSGFILSLIYAPAFAAGPDLGGVWRFLATRFARIAPLHYLTALAMIAVIWAQGNLADYGPGTYLANLAMVQAWTPAFGSFNPPAWSISTEWAAYLAFPLAAMLVAHRGLWMLAAAAAVGLYAWLFIGFGSMAYDPETLMIRGAAGFLTGMLAWKVSTLIEIRSGALLSLLQLLAVAVILGSLQLELTQAVLPPAFALLIVATIPDRGLVASLLCLRPVHLLGLWSYSIYLNHTVVIALVWALRVRAGDWAANPWPWFALSMTLTLAVSALTWRWIEVAGKKRVVAALLGRRRDAARAAGAGAP